MYTAQYFVDQLNLQAHSEGGYFSETYRSEEITQKEHLPERFAGNRHFSTAIYFLLEANDFSAFHRIKSDEVWHFYYGTPLNVYVILPGGVLIIHCLGNNPVDGSVFQAVVPAGCWFASKPQGNDGFSLVGCTVSPGFDFADFELAEPALLTKTYPQHATLITSLCHM